MGFSLRSESSSPRTAAAIGGTSAANTPSSTKWRLRFGGNALPDDDDDNNDFSDNDSTSSDWPLRTAAVRLSDNHLLHLALEASQSLDWAALSEPPVPTTAANEDDWTPVKLKDPSVSTSAAAASAASRAAVTRVQSRREGDRVVAVAHTVLPCSLPELTRVLDSASSLDVLRVLHGESLVSAECVRRVETTPAPASLAGLSVTAVAFVKRRRLSASTLFGSSIASRSTRDRDDEWCFVDFVQRISPHVVRKTLLALPTRSVLVDHDSDGSSTDSSSAQLMPDVLAGYLFEEQDDGHATRVSFWGEHALQTKATSSSSNRSGRGRNNNALQRALANRAGRARLLRLATSVDRFLRVVRRRRLGAQVLADDIQVRASNARCSCCSRSLLLARKRACCLCGYYVCDKCTRVEDRERRVRVSCSAKSDDSDRRPVDRTRTVVTRVRICELCIARVDKCNYNSVALEDLAPPRVRANTQSPGAAATASPVTTGALLERVLRSAAERAPNTDRAPVRRIVQDLVNQARASSDSVTAVAASASAMLSPVPELTDASSDEQQFAALRRALGRESVPAPDACRLADTEHRAYAIEHSSDAGGVHPHPVPVSEQRRLAIVRVSRLTALERVPELEVICAVVSRELGCLGALVTVSEADAFHVVATNIEALPARSFPRGDGFCSRTIMGVDPLLVPHPEADVRFSYISPVQHLGVSFYCGFPLFADDFTVLGSMCCLGSATGELSQSQFAVGKKLAETASRILQQHVALRTAASAVADGSARVATSVSAASATAPELSSDAAPFALARAPALAGTLPGTSALAAATNVIVPARAALRVAA